MSNPHYFQTNLSYWMEIITLLFKPFIFIFIFPRRGFHECENLVVSLRFKFLSYFGGVWFEIKFYELWVKIHLLSEKISFKIGWFIVSFILTLVFFIFKGKTQVSSYIDSRRGWNQAWHELQVCSKRRKWVTEVWRYYTSGVEENWSLGLDKSLHSVNSHWYVYSSIGGH